MKPIFLFPKNESMQRCSKIERWNGGFVKWDLKRVC